MQEVKNFEGFIGFKLPEEMKKAFFEKVKKNKKVPSQVVRSFINRYNKSKQAG